MNIELLPIGTHDHPEPHVMRWSELEIAAIRSYAQRCVLHDRNRGGQSLHCLSYDIANESAASDALELEAADELDRLRARVAELERDRVHAGVDICEVAAAVEVVRVMEIVKEVAGVVANLHEGPFRHGFEVACEEIEHRLRPCEHCDTALAKDGA